MRIGIPLLADRVAPRCTFAESILLVDTRRRRIDVQASIPLEGAVWADMAATLADNEVDTLVCGGISRSTRESVEGREVTVIDNVAGTSAEVLEALRKGSILPGLELRDDEGGNGRPAGAEEDCPAGPSDCLSCGSRECMEGKACPYLKLSEPFTYQPQALDLLESAWDVALEEERSLCRLAEVVYFALEIGCERIGVAFCEDLRHPAEILAGVLQRFFEVVSVSCRVVGSPNRWKEGDEHTGLDRLDVPEGGCDPGTVVGLLNAAKTDLNVLVGFCVGADCIFNRLSEAPVTTLFVKDKSLANNPIGAVYSHYYLKDI